MHGEVQQFQYRYYSSSSPSPKNLNLYLRTISGDPDMFVSNEG